MSEKISDAIALLTRQVRPGGETFAQRAEGKEVNGSDYCRANDLNDSFSIAGGTIPDWHFYSTQVVLKLKETQEHKRTQTQTKLEVSRDGLRSKRLCGFRRG